MFYLGFVKWFGIHHVFPCLAIEKKLLNHNFHSGAEKCVFKLWRNNNVTLMVMIIETE